MLAVAWRAICHLSIRVVFFCSSSVLLDLNFCRRPLPRCGSHVKKQGYSLCSFSTNCAVSAYAPLLRSYGCTKNLLGGMRLHAHIIHRRLELDSLLANLLVQMYGQCRALKEASAVFATLIDRDQFAWNFLIRAYAANASTAGESMHLFQRMLLEGNLSDRFILVGILSACTIIGNLHVGKLFHSCTAGSKMEMDPIIGTAFMNMYTRCDTLENVLRCFDKVREEDAVAFNALIAAFQQAGNAKFALQVFCQMQQQCLLPERVTFLNALSACSSEDFLVEGKQLHCYISHTEHHFHLAVETALVSMYGKCNCIYDAHKTFNLMKKHDVVAWNALIAVYVQHKNIEAALHLFEDMRCEYVVPDAVTFICIVDACGYQGFNLDKDWIQVNIHNSAIGLDMDVGIALMTMYGNCRNFEGAWDTFHSSPDRSISFCNAFVTVLAKSEKLDDALKLLSDMYQKDVTPDSLTYNILLDACADQMALLEGKVLHSCIIERHFDVDRVLSTSIISMYSKCGVVDEASKVFYTICDQNVVHWNAMITGKADNARNWEVSQFCQQMIQEGVMPNDITLLGRLSACFNEDAFFEGKRIHCCIIGTKYESNTVLKTALISMYSKCGSISLAMQIFNDLLVKDVVVWGTVMSAFVQDADNNKASVVFDQMLEEGALPDAVVWATILSSVMEATGLSLGKRLHIHTVATGFELEAAMEAPLISMYCRCGMLDEAQRLFTERLDRTVASWNAMMAGLIQSGHYIMVFQLFEQLQQEGLLPNHATLISILDACSTVATLTKGHRLHLIAGCSLPGNVKVEAALVTMYAECGSLNEAERVFNTISTRNLTVWMTIITANAQHGNGRYAIHLFNQMLDEGHVPTREILVSVFSACSHSGLSDDLKQLLNFLTGKVGLLMGTDLYNCAIDVYSRAGRLDEAEAIIWDMPQNPTVVSWTTLLGACKHKLDVERAERAVKRLLKLDSWNAEPYVALSNIYAAAVLDGGVQYPH